MYCAVDNLMVEIGVLVSVGENARLATVLMIDVPPDVVATAV